MLRYFASLDEYRYRLYAGLRKVDKLSIFPAVYNNHIDLAKSKLLTISYEKPDSIHYIDRLPAQIRDRKGYIYFFRYKQKKDDITWRIAYAGLVPEKAVDFEWNADKQGDVSQRRYAYNYSGRSGTEYEVTTMGNSRLKDYEPVKKQLEKQLKRLLYSLRRSGADFYSEYEEESDMMDEVMVEPVN